jgi:hypothetical protein
VVLKLQSDLDKLIASLKFLGLRPDICEYKWRFFVQKTAHLAQSLGLQTHYCFTIYVKGPYSKSLADDYYAYPTRVNALETEYELTEDDKVALEKIRNSPDLYQDMDLMECTATVVYLVQNDPNLRDSDILATLHNLKKHLNEATCVIGISKAKELLFKPEYLTENLKKEIDAWSKIDHKLSIGR